jgi:hypothetical protein
VEIKFVEIMREDYQLFEDKALIEMKQVDRMNIQPIKSVQD